MSGTNNPSGSGRGDTYDELYKNFSLKEQKSGGDISFKSNRPAARQQGSRSARPADGYPYGGAGTGSAGTKSGGTRSGSARSGSARSAADASKSARTQGASATRRASASAGAKRKKKKKKGGRTGLLLALVVVLLVAMLSVALYIPLMGCVKDILAIGRESTQLRVVVNENMKTSEIIDMLGEKGLIYSPRFCKFAAGFLHYGEDTEYPAGTYYLSPDMGLEEMLRTIRIAGVDQSTIRLTFPEGYTLDQIIEKLSNNGVASSMSLYSVLDDDAFFQQYDFLGSLTNREERYHALEGYLFPDTYEFYIGENPRSVFEHFLNTFRDKWKNTYSAAALKTGYSIDTIVTVASILEKEGRDADQMATIAGVLYNRLGSSSFPFLNCDSTSLYIDNAKDAGLIDETRYQTLLPQYDTYVRTGLPAGPICNPGADALQAAVSPRDTDAYYFVHDKDGNLYTASSSSEHQENIRRAGLG